MPIEYLISAVIGFAVAIIFYILPNWIRLLKNQFKNHVENIVINFLTELQNGNKDGNSKSTQTQEKKG